MDSNTPQDQGATGTGSKFKIPQAVRDKYPELVEQILKTESMTDEEREYWFQILPIMTPDQVTRLRKILDEEAKQLKELDSEYQDELKKLNTKHMQEWNEFEKTKEREARQQAEAHAEAEEKETEDQLLADLEKLDES
jgi:transketolase